MNKTERVTDLSRSQLRHQQLNRRHMLAATIAASVAPATCVVNAQEAQAKGYIDAHSHVWTPDTKSYPLDDRYDMSAMQPKSFTAEELMHQATASNVDRVVLIQMSFYGFDNSYMLDCIAKHPGKFSGVAVIDPEDKPIAKMKALKEKGVRGFRIVSGKKDTDSWLSGKGMQKMWRAAAKHSLSICPLINPNYLPSVDAMCEQFPDTKVVVDHFARIGVDGQIRESDVSAICGLARHKNTYVKASAFYALGQKTAPYADLGPMINKLVDAFGSNRLMWATDCPYQVQSPHTYADSIALIREKLAFLTEEDRNWMLGKTAEKVFFQ